MSRPAASRRANGFTLVEMMVCLVIAATLAALAVHRLRPARGRLSLRAALVKLESQDHLMRNRAKQSGRPGQLLFDLEQAEVTRIEANASGLEQSTPVLSSLDGPRVEQVRVMGTDASSDGRFRITCFGLGRTASYAVLVAAGEQRQWVVVSGLTGQFENIDDESQVRDIFQQANAGHDAR